MEDELNNRLYNFSEEFQYEFPEFVDGWYERKRKQEITNRNVEELQMRLNIQIEREKQRLWDDKKMNKVDMENTLGFLNMRLFDDRPEPFSIRKIMYDLFYDSPGYVVFDPSAIYFK